MKTIGQKNRIRCLFLNRSELMLFTKFFSNILSTLFNIRKIFDCSDRVKYDWAMINIGMVARPINVPFMINTSRVPLKSNGLMSKRDASIQMPTENEAIVKIVSIIRFGKGCKASIWKTMKIGFNSSMILDSIFILSIGDLSCFNELFSWMRLMTGDWWCTFNRFKQIEKVTETRTVSCHNTTI